MRSLFHTGFIFDNILRIYSVISSNICNTFQKDIDFSLHTVIPKGFFIDFFFKINENESIDTDSRDSLENIVKKCLISRNKNE